VQQGYERWAATYDRDFNPLLALEERILSSRFPSLTGKKVLDIACGTGRWLKLFARAGTLQCVGIDISAGMLAIASSDQDKRHKLVRADCMRIPLASGSVDFAICSFAIGHIRNLAPFAEECSRVLAVGGDLFVTDLHPDAYSVGWRTGFRDASGPAEIETIPRSVTCIARDFRSAGFTCFDTSGLHFSQPEQPIFAAAGKAQLFPMACSVTAVLFCRFCKVT
jgi:ubiquinone/menaquinone biosynthesis C-methylase UbiE